MEGNRVPYKYSKAPVKIFLQFAAYLHGDKLHKYKKHVIMNSPIHCVIMNPLVQFYLRQAVCGFIQGDDIRPIYFTALFLQRGHGIGSFLGCLWQTVEPLLWSSAKTLRREAILTRGKIVTGISENKSPDVTTRDIVWKHVTESTQNIINELRGGSQTCEGNYTQNKGKTKKARLTKRDFF
jgi:hypothetical protein